MLVPGAFTNVSAPLWEGFLAVCRARQSGDPAAKVRLYLEHEIRGGYHFSEIFDPSPFLPNGEQRDFQEYYLFLQKALDGRRFGLVINDLHLFHFPLWESVRPFFESVYHHLGRPSGGASFDLFFGNYHRTPFGIHKDDQDVFTWVVNGNKRFHLWPFERLSDRPELIGAKEDLLHKGAKIRVQSEAEYQSLLRESVVLDARPGDMMYWPASYWHCADNPEGALALTVGPGIVFEGDLVATQLQNVWKDILSLKTNEALLPGKSVSPSLMQTIRNLGKKETIREVQKEVAKAFIASRTGSSFFSIPVAREVEGIADDDILQLAEGSSLVWVSLSEQDWVIGANGHATCLCAPRFILKKLDKMLTTLRENPCSTRELLSAFQGKAHRSRSSARALLSLLVSWRALQVISS